MTPRSTDPVAPPKERRLHGRVPVRLDVLWKSEFTGNFAQITDVSPAGCFVNTAFGLREDEGVTLEVFLPRGGNVRLTGVVAHERWPAGFGVPLHGLRPDYYYGALLTLVG